MMVSDGTAHRHCTHVASFFGCIFKLPFAWMRVVGMVCDGKYLDLLLFSDMPVAVFAVIHSEGFA